MYLYPAYVAPELAALERYNRITNSGARLYNPTLGGSPTLGILFIDRPGPSTSFSLDHRLLLV